MYESLGKVDGSLRGTILGKGTSRRSQLYEGGVCVGGDVLTGTSEGETMAVLLFTNCLVKE